MTHSQEKEETTTGWEIEFLNDFCEERYSSANGFLIVTKDPGKVLEFIRETIAKERIQAKKEFADELRGCIHGMQCDPGALLNTETEAGYELALVRILALLPEQES